VKETLNFLIEAGKLKKIPRTGFVWLGIKNPETIAQHTFRVAIMNWILGEKVKPKLNSKKVIQISLAHDLCEVYAGDVTPYWGLLPRDKKRRQEILKRWIRLPQKIKIKREKIKFMKEKAALQKLIRALPAQLKKEIMICWLDYEKLISREGRFVKQGDKVETLLQALEYWGPKPNTAVFGWWEEVEDLVDEPVLLDFLKKIEKFFYEKKKAKGELKFLLEIGKLKTRPRTGWMLRKTKRPETIADHSFLFAISSWILSQGRGLDLEKALKMSLVYEFCEVYARDTTPHHELFTNGKKEKTLKRWPRLLKEERERRFIQDYKREKRALKKITLKLSAGLREEVISLWDDCKTGKTAEGRFVNQIYWLVTYLQALQYFEENKKFPILAWPEQMKEFIEDPFLLELKEEMEKKFLKAIKS